jgi:hypothetical protein
MATQREHEDATPTHLFNQLTAAEALAHQRFQENMRAAQAANHANFQKIFALVRFGFALMGHTLNRNQNGQ